jgi:uroporphyrinogen-III synthase
MEKLQGKRIAILGSRKIEELSKIIENYGGVALNRPAQGTLFLDEQHLQEDVERLVSKSFDWVLFTTGIGVETLFSAAEKTHKVPSLTKRLKEANIGARGYKTVNTLRKFEITPLIQSPDGTTKGLLDDLASYPIKNRQVLLQLHGDPAPQLKQWLENQGAFYQEIVPYKHIPPETGILDQLLSELLQKRIDAVTFTSTTQVRSLFNFAAEHAKKDALLTCFRQDVVAVAAGKVTGEALREEGVNQVIFPEHERMGSMIVELVKYYEQSSGNLSAES